jgi:hypothetical protein
MEGERLLPHELTTRVWYFGRLDGSTIATSLILGEDGGVRNYSHPNETAWRVVDDCLEFLDPHGRVTTRFDQQTANSNGVLSLAGRFAHDPNVVHILKGTPKRALKPVEPRPRVAVLVRTHIVCPKLLNLLEYLNNSYAYDLDVSADETRGNIRVPGYEVIAHSVTLCESMGLATNHPSLLWMCGDFPFYCAQRQIPNYDYYFQIEFDVHFVRQNPLYLEGLISRLGGYDAVPYDFLGTLLSEAPDHWYWKANAAKVYPRVYEGLFAFIGLSQSAVRYLFEERLAEAARKPGTNDLMHCEAFAASALMSAGTFKCATVNDLIHHSVKRPTFRPANPFLLGGILDEDPKVEMCHPVLDADGYLEKALDHASRTASLPTFSDMLQGLPPKLVPPEMKERFLRRASAQSVNGH